VGAIDTQQKIQQSRQHYGAMSTIPSFNQLLNKVIQMLLEELNERPQRFLIDLSLIFCFLYIMLSKSYKITKPVKLTPEEVNELLEEWTPEPLIPQNNNSNNKKKKKKESEDVVESPILASSALQTRFKLEGREGEISNFATFNFLGLVGDRAIIESCKKTILKYGVGSCGPRGFYGTIDIHLDLEAKLARFMGTDACIVYSYGFCTISSVIPAFSKRGDVILYDEGVNFATLQGIILSRSSFKSFKHNDTNDLKRALKEIIAKDNEKPVRNRRFIVINGVYENYGDIAPLEKIVQLAKQYKFRMIMDDSFGFGVLGKTGKGTVEHCNVNINDIDILTANLENSLASAGGFCVGTKQIVEHQRLSGLGYCFSASLPPFTSMASMQALSRLEQKPELMKQLVHNIKLTVDTISKALPECLRLDGSYCSPVMHIRYKGTNDSNITLEKFKKVVSKALERNLAVVCPKYSQRELNPPPPSIRISVSSSHTEDDINYCASVLRDILHQEFKTQE